MTLLMSATSPDNKKTAVDKGSFLTWTVCAICVAIFAGISQTDSGFRSTLLHMTSARFYSGSYWGLVTSVFTHLQLWHLLFNVYWLWILGGALERAIGRGNWIIFFLLSAMISSGTQLGVSGGTGIGASGVVYAMFGFVWFGREHYFNFRKIATKPTIILFLGWLIFCIIGTWLNIMRVANAAHIAGLLFGAGVAFLMLKSKKQTSISQSKTTSG